MDRVFFFRLSISLLPFFSPHASARYPTLHDQNLLEHTWAFVLLVVCFPCPERQDLGTEAGEAGDVVAEGEGPLLPWPQG